MSSRRIPGTAAFDARGPSLVAIGNFDGVHRGHQAMLLSAVRLAEERGLRPLVLTFHPHPAEVLGRGALPVLTTLDRKVALLLRIHPELSAVIEPFTLELSRLTPEEFAREHLASRLNARVVLVGENFRFGHGRAGDFSTLRALGSELGFEARVEPLVGDDEGPFSSTRAREAVRLGELERAERCLGRPHSLSGQVVRGDGRGRSIGVPTANLADVGEMLPSYGVYACLVDRADDAGGGAVLGRGVMNVGLRPTVAAGFSVEVHLIDFDADLYGQKLRVHLVQRLREERRFPGLPELIAQIQRDIQDATRVLAQRTPDPAAGGAWA